MLRTSFFFELKYRLKSPGTWICLVGLILMAYREMLAGEWDLLIQSGRVARNSPYTVYYLFMYYTFWAATVGSALVIPTLLRDLQSGTAELLYSYPIHSKHYFLGKYLAILIVFVLIMSSVAIGFLTLPYVATTFGTHAESEFVATPWAHIGHAFVLWVLPACFVYGSLTFALTALTGRTGSAYALMMLAVGLFVMITAAYGDGAPKSTLVQILDPLGKVTVEGQLYYWTAEERMEKFLAFEGALLQNRLLYMALATLVLLVALIKFDVRTFLQRAKNRDTPIAAKNIAVTDNSARTTLSRVPDRRDTANPIEFHCKPSTFYWLGHALTSGWQQCGVVMKNKAFYLSMLILTAMLVLAGFSYEPVDFEGSGKLLPKAFILLPGLMYPSLVFTLAAAAFFSIQLFDREKSFRIHQLVEACPVPTWSLMLAKLVAVVLMALVLALVPVVSFLCVQYGQGYFDTHWATVVHITLLVLLPLMLAYVLIALICYAWLPHKALAQGVAIIVGITPSIFNEVKTVENFMYLWAWPFFVQLSDFDASTQFVQRDLSFAVYWLSLYAALTVVAYWLWPRGTPSPIALRVRKAIFGIRPVSVALVCLFLGIFIWSATEIHSGMIVRNHYQSRAQEYAEQADYEKRYGATRHAAQPKIIAADLTVELYPENRRADYSATLTVTNKSQTAIEELVLQYADFTSIKTLMYNQQSLTPHNADPVHRRLSYRLPEPLFPGDIAALDIELQASYQGFSNDEFDYHGTLVADGSYFGAAMWPTFGYDRQRELESVGLRRQYKLGERQPAAPLAEAGSVTNLAISDDADFLKSRIRIATHSDQIPLAPGESNCQQQAARRMCIYQSQQAMPWNIHMVSGRYQLATATWQPEDGRQPVEIEVYFHPDHDYNVARFIDAAKQSLADGHRQWGAFPYQSLRIAEVPNALAESHVSGNLIIIPETHGWLHDYRQKPAIDWITYQVARDVSRIWWQQVAVADVRGQQLLTDAIPTLQGLRAIEAKWGPLAANRFVDQISDNYLRDRTTEDEHEVAIIDLDTERYASTKAALALYSAYHLLSPKGFTEQLGVYFTRHRHDTRLPYAHTGDLIEQLLASAPDRHREHQLEQVFYATRYYDFQVESARTTSDHNGEYQLQAKFSAAEYRYQDGKDHLFEYEGPIRVQVLGGDHGDVMLYDRELRFERGHAQLQLHVPQRPMEVVVNPQRQLLERSPRNNALTL